MDTVQIPRGRRKAYGGCLNSQWVAVKGRGTGSRGFTTFKGSYKFGVWEGEGGAGRRDSGKLRSASSFKVAHVLDKQS